MTLQQHKETVPKSHGFESWEKFMKIPDVYKWVDILVSEAAELYAKSKAIEMKTGIDDIICKYAVLGWPSNPEGIVALRKEIELYDIFNK